MSQTLAHLSDLHLGRSAKTDDAARQLCKTILEAGIDHVVVTGDITHRGAYADMHKFFGIFSPLHVLGRLTAIPGNHDRNGESCGAHLMSQPVETHTAEGLYLILLNTTGDHNHSIINAHGILTQEMLDQTDYLLSHAPERTLRVVLLHHHVLPLPVEGFGEWFAQTVGWPNAQELTLGPKFLKQVGGSCDLILHGHRHIPRDLTHLDAVTGKSLHLFNAGSSTELKGFRVFTHDAGQIEKVEWLTVGR